MKAEQKRCTATAMVALVIGCWSTLAAAQPGPATPFDGCNPCTEPNGQGIYILERVNYCIELDGGRRFCPEAFVEGAAGSGLTAVHLTGRLYKKSTNPPGAWTYVPGEKLAVHAKTTNTSQWMPLTGFKSDGSGLVLRYKTVTKFEQEADLSELILQLRELDGWELRFTRGRELIEGKERHGYRAEWIRPGGSIQAFCPGENYQDATLMYVLPGKQVDGLSGKVTEQPTRVTMACKTGAIATCMNWGYKPVELDSDNGTENKLLGACIQAKRAAYFLSSGDTLSYTKDGKTIAMKDHLVTSNRPHGVRDNPVSALEAVWTENGALCLNENNRRVDDPPLPNGWQGKLSACPGVLPEGPEYIFTGKVAQP